jgi:hypothetical protein
MFDPGSGSDIDSTAFALPCVIPVDTVNVGISTKLMYLLG